MKLLTPAYELWRKAVANPLDANYYLDRMMELLEGVLKEVGGRQLTMDQLLYKNGIDEGLVEVRKMRVIGRRAAAQKHWYAATVTDVVAADANINLMDAELFASITLDMTPFEVRKMVQADKLRLLAEERAAIGVTEEMVKKALVAGAIAKAVQFALQARKDPAQAATYAFRMELVLNGVNKTPNDDDVQAAVAAAIAQGGLIANRVA